jgi:hypothetical protein
MPDLKFEIISSRVKPYAVLPTLVFDLQITNNHPQEQVYAAALKCQLMIEAVKRRYDRESKDRLFELFGDHTRWEETLRSFFWQIINIPVPAFSGKTVIEINIPCSEELSTAAGKYFYSVRDDEVPLAFLFSGTLFYKNANDDLEVTMIPWEKEALYKMPASLWQELMDVYFPNCRWLSIRKDIYERLVEYKAKSLFPTLSGCLENILEAALRDNTIESRTYE